MKNQTLKSVLLLAGLSCASALTVRASEAEDMFKRMDINGDKEVTSLEHANWSQAMFDQADADHDGKISAAECESASTRDGKKVDKHATVAHMKLLDTDGDGQISKEENATFSRLEFTRADKDGNGSLNEDEVEAAFKAMKKQLKD